MVGHGTSIVRRVSVAATTVVLLVLVPGQGCPELDNLPFDIEELIDSLGGEGGPFGDRDRCERDCRDDAEQFLAGCRAGLADGASAQDCEDEAADRRDACKAGCPSDEYDDHDERDCEHECAEESDWAFEDCIAEFGDEPTEEQIEACDAAAMDVHFGCKENCRWHEDDDDHHGDDCEDACGDESEWVFEDCVDGFGDGDVADEDLRFCEDEACEEACVEESDLAFDICFEDSTADAVEFCDVEAAEQLDACKSACTVDDVDCEEACTVDSDSVFDDCFDGRKDEAHDVCGAEADEPLYACKEDCGYDDGDDDDND